MQPAQITCGAVWWAAQSCPGESEVHLWAVHCASLAPGSQAGLSALVYSTPHGLALPLLSEAERRVLLTGLIVWLYYFCSQHLNTAHFAWAVFTNSKFILPIYFFSESFQSICVLWASKPMNGFGLFLLKFVWAVFDVRECPEPFGNNKNSQWWCKSCF